MNLYDCSALFQALSHQRISNQDGTELKVLGQFAGLIANHFRRADGAFRISEYVADLNFPDPDYPLLGPLVG